MLARKSNLSTVISHWYHFFEDLNLSTESVYTDIEQAIQRRELKGVHVRRVVIAEGGAFSAKRTYLRVTRKSLIFDICAAPYGKGFFVSWWLSEPLTGCLLAIAPIPVLNVLVWMLLPPMTYFKVDTALMFQDSVHFAVQEVLGRCLESRRLRWATHTEHMIDVMLYKVLYQYPRLVFDGGCR